MKGLIEVPYSDISLYFQVTFGLWYFHKNILQTQIPMNYLLPRKLANSFCHFLYEVLQHYSLIFEDFFDNLFMAVVIPGKATSIIFVQQYQVLFFMVVPNQLNDIFGLPHLKFVLYFYLFVEYSFDLVALPFPKYVLFFIFILN